MADIKTILSTLNAITEKNSFDVYIPSLKREVKFKPLSTKQQQSFYSCAIDTIPFNTRFVITTFEAITENCYEPDIISQLTTIDRLVILLALRKNTLGADLAIVKNDTLYTGTLNDCLKNAKAITIPDSKTVEVKNIRVLLSTPLMVDQYGVEKALRENINIKMSPDELLKQAVLCETSKIVKSISVINEDKVTDLGYNQLNYKDRLAVIESLPAEIMLEVQQYVSQITEITNSLLTVNISDDATAIIDITVDFFLSS